MLKRGADFIHDDWVCDIVVVVFVVVSVKKDSKLLIEYVLPQTAEKTVNPRHEVTQDVHHYLHYPYQVKTSPLPTLPLPGKATLYLQFVKIS